MYPLDAIDALRTLQGRPFRFINCASFEERWDGFATAAKTSALVPTDTFALFPRDTGSAWEKECADLQDANWARSTTKTLWGGQRVVLQLNHDAPWNVARSLIRDRIASSGGPLVIDISTMPRVCFFPMIEEALATPTVTDLVVIYSEPKEYGEDALACEPLASLAIPPFDRFPIAEGAKPVISWVPILGFGAQFATTVYESLADTCDLGPRVYPLIGYPAYRPHFFDRVFNDSARVIIDQLKGAGSLREQFQYAAADDPFETRDAILRLVGSGGGQSHWVGTPMGSKPMALGMLMAAIATPMTVLISPAKSYNPRYSSGYNGSRGYVLKRNGIAA